MLIGSAAALLLAPIAVSYASIDITPDEPLPLGGYTDRKGRLFEPGGDRLYARSILFQQGNMKIAVVMAEMLTIPESLVAEVRKRIPAGTHLFLAATHTHCAPDSQMLNERMTFPVPGIATFNRRWMTWYAEKIAEAVSEASNTSTRSAVSIYVGAATLTANKGRRDGAWPDATLTVVSAPNAMLLHYAAHPVLYGPDESMTRGDWPGALAQALALPGVAVLQGAIGDVTPDAQGATAAERTQDFVARALAAVGQTRSSAMPVQRVAWTEAPITLASPQPHPEFAQRYSVPQAVANTVVSRFAPNSASVTAFRLGKLAFVGIPGEPTSHLGRKVRDAGRRMGFDHVLVCSLVNGWMGYILDADDYRRGGYEATLSFYGVEQGNKVAAAAITALERLAGK